MESRVTIGQAARFAGTTIKTIRHYHRLGAVPEPERDASGYRRYGSADLLRLVQARTLAESGVAVRDIGTVLAGAGSAESTLDQVERQLTARIQDLQRRRDRVRLLRFGERALMPERAAHLLARMETLGFDPACVTAHQEAWVLACALAPEQFEEHAEQVASRLDDPLAVVLMKRSWEAASWAPDDPRLPELAREVVLNLMSQPGHLGVPSSLASMPNARERVQIINHHRGEELPTSVVLTHLIEGGLRAAGVPIPYT